MIDFDDWLPIYAAQAATQGWCLSETGDCGHAPIEVQRWDNAQEVSKDWQLPIPQLASDDEAVYVFQQAWIKNEFHAVLAYHILANCSPMEFAHWDMASWRKNSP